MSPRLSRIPRVRRLGAAGAALTLGLTLTACGTGGSGDSAGACEPAGSSDGLTLLAAASLTDVFDDLAQLFEEQNDVAVTASYGSSTDLADQAAECAPGDVLATADQTSMEAAEAADVTGEVETFATNELVIVTAPGNPMGVGGLEDLDDTLWVRCADEVPCGRVALGLIESSGIVDEPQSLEEDVRATLERVTSGEADAALVYATDAVAAGDAVETVEIEGAEEQLTSYFVTTLSQSGDRDLAQAWVDLVLSEEGQQILQEAGFNAP